MTHALSKVWVRIGGSISSTGTLWSAVCDGLGVVDDARLIHRSGFRKQTIRLRQ